jgi:hypothetical protein
MKTNGNLLTLALIVVLAFNCTVEAQQQTINAHVGWNFLSVPVAINATPWKSIFQNGTIAWEWILCEGTYGWMGVPGDLDGIRNLENGKGYWVQYPDDEAISIDGGNLTSLTIYVCNNENSVNGGWNMIGSLSESIPVSTITSDPPGMILSPFYRWDGGYFDATTIDPGKAYWVKVSQFGTLTLSVNASADLLAKRAIVIVPTSELPPPPPGGEKIVNSTKELPKAFALGQNYPNPFNPTTIINYQLPTNNWVTIKVYNVLGEEVTSLVDGIQDAGYKSVKLDATNMQSGMYFYRMTVGSLVDVKKILLLK